MNISRSYNIIFHRTVWNGLVRSFCAQTPSPRATPTLAIGFTDSEVDEVWRSLAPDKWASRRRSYRFRHPLLSKYKFNVIDFLRGAQYAVDVLCENAMSRNYRNYLDGKVRSTPESDFIASVCAPAACDALEKFAAFDTSADWPVRDHRNWGIRAFSIFLPHLTFTTSTCNQQRHMRLEALQEIDILVTKKDRKASINEQESGAVQMDVGSHSHATAPSTTDPIVRSASPDRENEESLHLKAAANTIEVCPELLQGGMNRPDEIRFRSKYGATDDSAEPDSDVSVVIRSTFMMESVAEVRYEAEGYPSDFLPSKELVWKSFCDVYFQSTITDGEDQNWTIADIVFEN